MGYTPREERRTRLAEAVWRIILENGVGAVSVRSVAAEAGMAPGSLRHLFPTQAGLLESSAELIVERATARVSAIAPNDDSVEYALEAIEQLLPLTPESRREFEVNIALIAATPANPGLARVRDLAHHELLDLFTRIAAMLQEGAGSAPENQRDGRRLLALADGLGLHLLHQPQGDDTSWATDIIREELERIRGERPTGT